MCYPHKVHLYSQGVAVVSFSGSEALVSKDGGIIYKYDPPPPTPRSKDELLNNVKTLVHQGKSDEEIIQQISGWPVYPLGATDLINLKKDGVSDKVSTFLLGRHQNTQAE